MGDFTFRISPNIVLGSYTASRLGQFALDFGTRYMVILDPVLKGDGLADNLLQPLTDHNVNYFVFDDVAGEASTKVVESALKLARDAHVQGIIAAGGSHTLNVGRAVCALFNAKTDLYSCVDAGAVNYEPIPLISVPSAMVDLFVFTDRLPLVDSRNQKVALLKVPQGLSKLVLFDPNLSNLFTENQVSSLALEILCVGLEAYISQKATFFSDMLIEKSLEIMSYALATSSSLSVTTPREVLLCQAGMMVSLASATSACGVSSLISLCVDSRFAIPQRLSTCVLFPHIIEDAANYKMDKLIKFARILKFVSEDTPNEECVSGLLSYIRQNVMAKVQLPIRFKDLNVSIEQLSFAAEMAGNLDLINTLPRSMSTDELFDMVKRAY